MPCKNKNLLYSGAYLAFLLSLYTRKSEKVFVFTKSNVNVVLCLSISDQLRGNLPFFSLSDWTHLCPGTLEDFTLLLFCTATRSLFCVVIEDAAGWTHCLVYFIVMALTKTLSAIVTPISSDMTALDSISSSVGALCCCRHNHTTQAEHAIWTSF